MLFGNFFVFFFRNRWIRTFFVALCIAALVWFVGPMIGFGAAHPLDTEFIRELVIAGIFVLWLVWNLIQMIKDNKREKALAAGITEKGPDEAAKERDRATAEEKAVVDDRLKEALKTLKSSKTGAGKKLSQLPWYMFIGPPGAGKTTALVNCGLKFPLADKEGPTALRGIGGTRNCEWWFADEAVLIDTAGRYTTQDSEAEIDAAGWLGFLRTLKKHRRRQPINGVIVGISLSDLSLLSDEERQSHAKAVRRRIRELNDELGVTPPIYVLFTKADLIAGFVEFFENLGKEEREQVWGATFALDDGKTAGGAVTQFESEFDLLLERLNDRMLERVHQEPDIRRRRLIYGFPQQVATLREVANEFLQDCFRPSRLEPRALLRGFYLTSGTQDGTPIDRLLGTMAAEFGLSRQAVGNFSGTGRSYFLTRFAREVVFGEAALVSTDPKVERRIRWTHRAAYALAVLTLALLGAAWTESYFGNRQLITEVHAATTRYAGQYDELAKRGPTDIDLANTVPPLDTLRGMHGGYGERDHATPIALTFGLYQGAKLGIAATDAYANALNRLLLPRIMARLEIRMAASMNDTDVLYQVLKVYLMLDREGPLDKDLVKQLVTVDLLTSYPGEEEAPLRDSIMQHVDAMLDQKLQPVPINDDLVAKARAVLTREPLAQYSYNRILRSKTVKSIPIWSVAENGGPESARLFQFRSGKSLNEGVPGIFTWVGYHNIFQAALQSVATDISEDGWVLGHEKRDLAATLRDSTRLRKDVFSLYLDDYTRRWDQFLADLEIKPFTTMQEGLDLLSVLSAPSSPLRELMTGVDQQTQLSRAAPSDAAAAAAQARAGRMAARAGQFAAFEARSGLTFRQQELTDVMAQAYGSDPGGKPIDPAKRVDEHFKVLHEWVVGKADGTPAADGTGAPEDQLDLHGLQPGRQLAESGPGDARHGRRRRERQRYAIAAIAGTRAHRPADRRADVDRGCHQRRTGHLGRRQPRTVRRLENQGVAVLRYRPQPLSAGPHQRYRRPTRRLQPIARPERTSAEILRPIPQAAGRHLAASVEMAVGGARPLGFSPSSLGTFELANDIRESLFPGGASALSVRFQLNPVNLDPSVGQISLDIGGKRLTDNHGPTEPAQFQWPGPDGQTPVRVTMTPASGGNADVHDYTGPWALLRMLDAARITPSNEPDKFRIQFTGGGGTATMDLIASSVRNPFNLAALRSYRCPPKL